MLKLYDLRTEYRRDPLGIDARAPRFSWKLQSDRQNVAQKSCRITVTGPAGTVWDSGTIESDRSVALRYEGEELKPRTLYSVRVCVTDDEKENSEITGRFETGLMSAENWQADWITHGFEDDLEPPAIFVKRFSAKVPVARARLYASALGIYEFTINGKSGSDVKFAPGWTSYQAQIQYQTYDVTELLDRENELCITVANGWWKGILGFYNTGDHYGKRTAVIAQLELDYADGSRETICTDESWITTTGPIRYSEIYHGETVDRSMGMQESRPAAVFEHPKGVLIAQQDEPVCVTQRIPGKALHITPEGETVIDFGQNLTGVVTFSVKRPKGTKIVIRHAEALDEKGSFFTRNLRTAKATDTFICSGEEDTFQPEFTYHGFRYIAVDGLGRDLDPADFTACVIHTDLEQAGEFSCSDSRVNRLMENINWGLRDNFLDIPSDCPQRDERLGYTGDGEIFLPTAMCLRNVALFFEKWLRDLKYEQSLGDGVPTTVPNIIGPNGGIALFHDAGCIFPWKLYETYGDLSFLEQHFDTMKATVDYYTEKLTDEGAGLIRKGTQLGDWVSMDVARGTMLNYLGEVWNLQLNEKIGATDPYFVANVCYAYDAELTAKAARALGKEEEAEEYQALHDRLISAMRNEYVTPNGRIVNDTQTSNILALAFHVVEEKDRTVCLQRLLSNLQQHSNHLTTGFAGTPYLCPVLSENGCHDVAGSVFLKDDCPSWLYPVKLGATTTWELWDGVNPDGSFNGFEMNSLNHYSYGSIGNWMFRYLLGLQLLEPGYKRSRIAPRLVKGIPEVRGAIETVYGRLACAISCYDGKYTADVEIPAGTVCRVCLPGRESEELGSGCYHFEYETEDVFVKERYDEDTTLQELLANPVAEGMLNQYAPDLMGNAMFLQFAKARPLGDIKGMLPQEAWGLFKMVLQECNRAEKQR